MSATVDTRPGPLARVRAVVAAYAPELVHRRPRVVLRTAAWLPGWMLRAAVGVLGVACVLGAGPAPLVWWLAGVGFAVVAALRPGGALPGAVAVAAGVLLVLDPEPPSAARSAVLLLFLHAMAQLAAVCGRVGPLGRVELGVLRQALPRFLVLQALAQAVALLGGWLAGRRLDLPVLTVLVLLGFGVLVSRLGRAGPTA